MIAKSTPSLPVLSAVEFAILSAVVSQSRRVAEVARAVGATQRQTGRVSCSLAKAGFLIRRRGRRPQRSVVLTATPAGREAWLEFADWAAFTAERFADEPRRRPRQRTPDAAMQVRILAAAHPELNRFCRALWGIPGATTSALILADVGDFDPDTGRLLLQGEAFAAEGDALAALRESAAGRSAGEPLLPRQGGGRWRKPRDSFGKLRRRLGLPADVKLRGIDWRRIGDC